MKDLIKLCKDCKHHSKGDMCNAPNNMTQNVVLGGLSRRWNLCATNRTGRAPSWFDQKVFGAKETSCYEDAIWFEEKSHD